MARSPSRLRGSAGPRGPVVVGLETGGDHLGVALWRLPEDPGSEPAAWRLLEERITFRGHRHATTILAWLDEILVDHELDRADIELLACGRGPGGFTGIRVGMATALGLSLGLGRPVWAVDSLCALALRAPGDASAVVPLIDAKRGEVYGAAFDLSGGGPPRVVLEPMVDEAAVILEAARARFQPEQEPLIFGSGAIASGCASEVPSTWHIPSAAQVALLGAMEWERAGRDAGAAPSMDPAYVRRSDAEIEAERRERLND
jgi:tRNA threonylcarbamoyladenosine biosynthesis protein TsaB